MGKTRRLWLALFVGIAALVVSHAALAAQQPARPPAGVTAPDTVLGPRRAPMLRPVEPQLPVAERRGVQPENRLDDLTISLSGTAVLILVLD